MEGERRAKKEWKKQARWNERQIYRVVEMVCALNYHSKNYTGTVPGWRTASGREQQPSNICLNIRLTPGVIYARCRADVLQTNIFKIHNDSFITLQKELGFRCLELIIFLVEIWKLVTASCAGRKYQTAAKRYLSIWCSTVCVSFCNFVKCADRCTRAPFNTFHECSRLHAMFVNVS